MCSPVVAYKDHVGKLHETAEACYRANLIYKENQCKENAENAIMKCVSGINWYYSDNIRIKQQLGSNWKQLRDLLNAI